MTGFVVGTQLHRKVACTVPGALYVRGSVRESARGGKRWMEEVEVCVSGVCVVASSLIARGGGEGGPPHTRIGVPPSTPLPVVTEAPRVYLVEGRVVELHKEQTRGGGARDER